MGKFPRPNYLLAENYKKGKLDFVCKIYYPKFLKNHHWEYSSQNILAYFVKKLLLIIFDLGKL